MTLGHRRPARMRQTTSAVVDTPPVLVDPLEQGVMHGGGFETMGPIPFVPPHILAGLPAPVADGEKESLLPREDVIKETFAVETEQTADPLLDTAPETDEAGTFESPPFFPSDIEEDMSTSDDDGGEEKEEGTDDEEQQGQMDDLPMLPTDEDDTLVGDDLAFDASQDENLHEADGSAVRPILLWMAQHKMIPSGDYPEVEA